MRLLVLGGTAWLGRELASQAVAAGHAVVCAARGESGGVPEGAALVAVDRSVDGGLRALAGERFDAVVDVSRQPGHVRRAAAELDVPHWVYVSSGSVYAEQFSGVLDESAPLAEPITTDEMTGPQDYPGAKAACEAALRAALPEDRLCVARLGLIGGPGDHTGRSGYWPWRFAQGRPPVLVPAGAGREQLIDVRDAAAWLLRAATEPIAGTFNVASESFSFAELLAASRAAAGAQLPVVEADAAWLLERGVRPWMGPDSLPLWIGEPGDFVVDTTRFTATRPALRPLPEQLAAALAFERTRERPTAGLSEELESRLVAELGR